MKVLLANYRYFPYGGPERYLFNVEEALSTNGHTTVPFALNYRDNRPTSYQAYFPPPLAAADEPRFRDHSWTLKSLYRTLERSFYSPEVERAAARLIEDERPDVAYILQYLRKFSPSLLKALKDRDVPIVVRLSAATMVCPQGHFMRNGTTCNRCLQSRNLWPSLRHRCVQGSLAASLVHYASSSYHQYRHFFDYVDAFVVPSQFLIDRLVEGGWPECRFINLPTFVAPMFFSEPEERRAEAESPCILYIGPYDLEKGTDLLIRAYSVLRRKMGAATPPLVMVGIKNGPTEEACRALLREVGLMGSMVELSPFAGALELRSFYHRALCTVIPSRCYENMPNVLLESYATGTPVIGAGHGSIQPLIQEGRTGLCFPPGDHEALARCLEHAAGKPAWASRAGLDARDFAEEHFRQDTHVASLIGLFEDLVSSTRTGSK